MSNSFLPASNTDRVAWLNNFSSRLGQYRVALGLTTAEVNSVIADAEMFAYVVGLYDATRQHALTLSNVQKQIRSASQQTAMPALPSSPNLGPVPAPVNSGIFNRVVSQANIIKQSGAYTTAMGTDLGIIAPVTTFDPNTMTPDLSIRLESGFPLLKWKKGESDGAKVYVDRHDNNGFVLLKQTVRTSCIDTHPLAPNTMTATWDYKMRFMIEDDEVGNFSPIISINVFRAQ